MKYSKLLKFLLASCLPFFGVDDDDGGATVDRGDNFVSTEDTDAAEEAAAIAAAKASAKEAEDAAAAKAAEEEEAAKLLAKTEAEKAAAKDDKDDKKKDARIPLSRHESVLARERAAREAVEIELNALKAGKQAEKTNDVIAKAETELEAKEVEYNKQLADGQLAEASKTMKEIRLMERGINDQKNAITIAAAEARAVETVRFSTTIDRLEEAYPQIRPGHEDYDAGVVAEMLEMQGAFQAKGYAPSAALQKAVSYILKPTTAKQEAATTVVAKVSEEDAAEALKAQRKAEAVGKNLDAAGKTPPNSASVGKDSDKAGGGIVDAKAVMKMSQNDFAKLDEDALSKLRGDVV